MIDGGYLVGTRTFAPAGGGPDLRGIRTRGGDYDAAELAEAMDQPMLIGDAVHHYAQHAAGLPAIAFCVSVKHAQDTAAAFREAGWRAVAAHGGMSTPDRDAALCGLSSSAVQVLCTCDLVSEGLDVPVVGAVILLRPTQSLCLHLQQIGRGLRPAEGKQHLVVLDHAGNSMRHGLAETPRQWSLDGRPKKAPAPAVRTCPECYAVHAPALACPECGHSYAEPAGLGRRRQLERRDGELQEIDADALEKMRAGRLRDVLRGDETRAELVAIGKVRGYKPGWAWKVLQTRTADSAMATAA